MTFTTTIVPSHTPCIVFYPDCIVPHLTCTDKFTLSLVHTASAQDTFNCMIIFLHTLKFVAKGCSPSVPIGNILTGSCHVGVSVTIIGFGGDSKSDTVRTSDNQLPTPEFYCPYSSMMTYTWLVYDRHVGSRVDSNVLTGAAGQRGLAGIYRPSRFGT